MTIKSSVSPRYLALWFPFLPTDRLYIQTKTGGSPDAPVVFVELIKGAMRLTAVDQRAQGLDLEPGLTLADARARVPGLVTANSNTHADLDWLARLADGCQRYTPRVALAPPTTLILDITGCAHLFGGERNLADDAVARLARLGMTVRTAFATTPEAAHALARYQSTPILDEAVALSRLPVAALGLTTDSILALRRAGLTTVGDVTSRSMQSIASRFGADAVMAIRQLAGQVGSPLNPRHVTPILTVERRFHEPVTLTAQALAVITELTAEAGKQMEERKEGGRIFEASLFRVDGVVRHLSVEVGVATRDPDVVTRLIRERIDTLDDPLNPGFGFDLVRLRVPFVQPLADSQLAFEGRHVADTQVAALIDRLSTRLGAGRIRRFASNNSHIPEQAQRLQPLTGTTPPAWPAPKAGEPPLRPLQLFDPPQIIDVVAEVPDGPPHRFRWRRRLHEVTRYEGPERIASEWWRRQDGRGLTRDYYRVEDMRGRRYWLFRHGLYDECPDPRWYLHGQFA